MGVQKISSETTIKEWDSPKLIVLDISNTKAGGGQTEDGDGYEGDIPVLIS